MWNPVFVGLCGLFLLGVVFLLISALVYVIFRLKRKKTKLPLAFLIPGGTLLLVSVATVGMIRGFYTNTYRGYVDTGKMVSYELPIPNDYSEDYHNRFTLDGTVYVPTGLVSNRSGGGPELLKKINSETLSDLAVANLASPEPQDKLDVFMKFIFNINQTQTLYRLQGNLDVPFLCSEGGGIFCRQSDYDKVMDFYLGFSDFVWETNPDEPVSNEGKPIELDPSKMTALEKFIEANQTTAGDYHVGTNIYLSGHSKDRFHSADFSLVVVDGKVYSSPNSAMATVPLPPALSGYFLEKFNRQ